MQERTAPVFLWHRLALVDFLPHIPAFDKVAILGKHALLLLGHIPAELRRVDAAFPFFRHIHHAGADSGSNLPAGQGRAHPADAHNSPRFRESR